MAQAGHVSDVERAAYAARIRAAQGYAGLSREKFAAALDMSVRNLNTLKAGRGPIPHELRQRVAQVCGVPEWFMEHGFAAENIEPTVAERLETLERRQKVVYNALETHGLLPGATTQQDRHAGAQQAADSAEQAGRQRTERPPNPSSAANGHTQEHRSS